MKSLGKKSKRKYTILVTWDAPWKAGSGFPFLQPLSSDGMPIKHCNQHESTMIYSLLWTEALPFTLPVCFALAGPHYLQPLYMLHDRLLMLSCAATACKRSSKQIARMELNRRKLGRLCNVRQYHHATCMSPILLLFLGTSYFSKEVSLHGKNLGHPGLPSPIQFVCWYPNVGGTSWALMLSLPSWAEPVCFRTSNLHVLLSKQQGMNKATLLSQLRRMNKAV